MRRSLSTTTLQVGKAGVNEKVIKEIKRQLKDKELVRIRFARSIASKKETYINEIIIKTNAKLIDLRGNVAIIFKKKG
ncbi:MAG TPA: YhbY family RNA-binding protein [Methanothermobacter sp.]|jgi:RNA-binding protein|uniref:RNA-binding protein n=1 Tax=Methanothermobacter tenebrarum TaxID=680118 RepID=A0ABN6PFK9_9EURY|nr:YhbY family RNA-binding protein [Methanothermobacter tenebrarum]MDD3454380.1 YhbY family RNA-binding protein [Methanobacteriales archaeon]MDX9692878.1 YhbY family RNA-binding protein [Methanothermobacter sp.]BDH79990.1 RNA-binding protein [Methanothermobacter tenebrarum]HHW16457.1 YhbY family RNA-binding protein [Methanothermobacter sp.]